MTFLLVILAGLTLFGAGGLIGYIIGERDGAESAYDAVERYHEGRTR